MDYQILVEKFAVGIFFTVDLIVQSIRELAMILLIFIDTSLSMFTGYLTFLIPLCWVRN